MSLAFLLDEHLRGPLWRAIESHNRRATPPLDAIRVGDPEDIPLGLSDPQILQWAERENRILVTHDRSTMPEHVAAHLAAGAHCPGVFLLPRGARISDVVAFLALADAASDPEDWADRVEYVKL
jgi:hypothetical protein